MKNMSKLYDKADTVRSLLMIPDGVDIDKYFIATYYIETASSNPIEYAEGVAIEQTTGTWSPVPDETPEVREKYAGKVVSLVKIPRAPTSYVVQIAFPEINIDPNFNLLLSTVAGNVAWWGIGMRDYAFKMIDLWCPTNWLKQFKGPKHGLRGIREYLNIIERPILNNMIKPCTGITVDVHARLFRNAAFGGVDIIKDDELLGDPPFCPFFERLNQCMNIVDEKFEETGFKTLYTINMTDRTDKLLEKGEKAVELGANALMVDSSIGLEGMRMLADDLSIKVPILFHTCWAGNFVSSEFSGLSPYVYTKLARMAGADICLVPDYYGKFPASRDNCIRSVSAALLPLHHIKQTMCLIGGGVHPGTVPHIIEEYGRDVLIGAGGAIHAHPMGSTAGAKAFRQAIDAVMAGIELTKAAEDNTELRVALNKWGYPTSESKAKSIYDLAGGERPESK